MRVRNSSRRSFVKLLTAAPLLSQIAARDLYAQAASAIGKDPRKNVYTRLGVKTVAIYSDADAGAAGSG